jgi:hypothetical protein
MKSVLCLFALTLAISGIAEAQQAFNCPRGSEDMLNYFVLSYPNRTDHFMGPGNANPIYTTVDPEIQTGFASQGTFYWVKSANGYPWDVNTFDQNYVYHRATELKWTDPTTFKREAQDMPLTPRCVSTRSSTTTIKLPPSRTAYSFYSNCQSYQTANLSYVANSISRALWVNTGGNLGTVKTRLLTYTYACNSSYSGCQYKEVFSLGQGVGLYDWKYYIAQSGQWIQKQESIINNYSVGASTPYFACPNTYQ